MPWYVWVFLVWGTISIPGGLLAGKSIRRGLRGNRAAWPCVCGHTGETHEHYRKGTDCGRCPCTRYSRRVYA